MRAISLWQPWATAVALGSKRIETRHWATGYRGPLAIHAAKRKVRAELHHYASCWNWVGAMRGAGWAFGNARHDKVDEMPFGAIVAVCDLIDCRPTDSFTQAELDTPERHADDDEAYSWTQRQMGNFDLGRFGWVLDNIRALPQPVPFRGGQSFFTVPDDLL